MGSPAVKIGLLFGPNNVVRPIPAPRSVRLGVLLPTWTGVSTLKTPFGSIPDLTIRALVNSALDYRGSLLRSGGIRSEIGHNIFIHFRSFGNTTGHPDVALPRSHAAARDDFSKSNAAESINNTTTAISAAILDLDEIQCFR